MTNKKFKIIFAVSLILLSVFNASAEHTVNINLDKSDESIFHKLMVYITDIDANDPWNSFAEPGQDITVDVCICNWDNSGDDYSAQVYLIDSYGNGDMIWSTPSNVYIPSGECAPDYFFNFNAPTTPGIYTVEVNSFKVSDWSLDDTSSFALHVQSPGTPTGTGTGTATATGTATPTNNPPIAKITYLQQGGSKLTLYGTESTDTDGTISEFSWYIDNVYVNGQSTFTHAFDEPGNYVVRLEVTDDDGCSNSALLFVTISEPDDNSPGVIIDNIDDSKAITQEPINEKSQKGIWIENGRLMIPGFSIVFSILGLLVAIGILHKRKR